MEDELDDAESERNKKEPSEKVPNNEPKTVEEVTKDDYMIQLENALADYILLHCAKMELSLIEVSTGATFTPESLPNQLATQNHPVTDAKDLMQISLRQNVLN